MANIVWESALVEADVWKRRERCKGSNNSRLGHDGIKTKAGNYHWSCCECGHKFKPSYSRPLKIEHDIPAPAIGDAEATLKMLEWLIEKDCHSSNWHGEDYSILIRRHHNEWMVNGKGLWADTLPLALASAVNGVKV